MKKNTTQYKIFLDSSDLVCKPNAIGVSRLANYVRENGWTITTDVREADVIIVNTCGFTEWCELETCSVFQGHFENRKPGARVVSVGCLNVINRSLLEASFSDLHIVDDYKKLDEMLGPRVPFDELKESSFDQSLFDIVPDRYQRPLLKGMSIRGAKLLHGLTRRAPPDRVRRLHVPQIIDEIERANKTYVLIGRGCMNRCSYCIIKKAQGDPKSRPVADILADIRKKYTDKHAFVLVADDCASYGGDVGETFLTLLDKITAEFPEIRIDIGYINPVWLQKHTDEYLEVFRKVRINNVNISLQSGSDRIIGMMNRKYDVAHILRFVDGIKEVSPETMVWTHALVGFPSETWRDFLDTLRALDHFHYYNVYAFSPRAGTPAAQLPDRVPPKVAEARARLAYLRLMQRVGLSALRAMLPLGG